MPPNHSSNALDEPPRARHPVVDKLGRFVPLTDEENDALRLLARDPKRHRRGTDLISEGEEPMAVFMLVEGWAFRYKQLEDGSRQIMAFLIPGDMCDVRIFLFEEMDHSIGLLSDAKVVKIPAAEILELVAAYPRIERALLWATMVDEATLREWLLNVGQRGALQRLGHLFCELCVRLKVVGLADDDNMFTMPLTQTELADTTGMTAVHVNRSLQRLRKEGVIATSGGKLTILDFARLATLSGFNEVYLHTDGPTEGQKLQMRSTPK